MSSRSPLLGYNHNLRYKGRVYHIQTEDSGETNPHIFTHLFHNGIIIATKKTEYSDVLGTDDADEKVRKMMQLQHKDMMSSLIKGMFDEKILKYFGAFATEEDAQDTSSSPSPLDPVGHSMNRNAGSQSMKPLVPGAASIPAPPEPKPSAKPRNTPSKRNIISSAYRETDTLVDEKDWARGRLSEDKLDSDPFASGDFSENDVPAVTVTTPPKQEGTVVVSVMPMMPSPDDNGGVVISRPAIILTGDNDNYGNFGSSVKKGTGSILKVGSRSDIPHDTKPLEDERPNRMTGPVTAPPGLFKPDTSRSIPDEFMSLDDMDTKVDDIILEFLRQESTTKNTDD
ncbi:MAG: hypothetical protein JXR95_01130 [Deltaproteobacteria bacterium]|nr:hypothetical protein [Deltaproteobacteria bacterium]